MYEYDLLIIKSHYPLGFPDMDVDMMSVYLLDVKKQRSDIHVYIVWNSSPTHRFLIHRQIEGLTLIQLFSYSSELNPSERFF